MFEDRAEIYHSFWTLSLSLDTVGILLNNLLKRELKSLMGSFSSAFKLEKSLIRVVVDLSSPNLVKNYSWKASQLLIELDANEKYHDLAFPCKVYRNNLITVSSSTTSFKLMDNMKLFICSSASRPLSGLNLVSISLDKLEIDVKAQPS